MFTLREVGVSLLAAALFCLPLNTQAGAGPRLVPKGTVTLLESGTSVDQEIPAPAGMLMACKGQCYVEAGGMQALFCAAHAAGTLNLPHPRDLSASCRLAVWAPPCRSRRVLMRC